MKGQVSTELLIIVALVLLIFIPLLVLVYLKANEANQQVASYQAELAVSRIASLANSVGSLGTNTTVTTDVFVPPNTVNFTTIKSGRGGEIVLTLNTPQGVSEVNDIIKYPLSNPTTLADASNAGGRIKLKISSEYVGSEAYVRIERVS
jgi:uncharacterized protein (UPF0333 family)